MSSSQMAPISESSLYLAKLWNTEWTEALLTGTDTDGALTVLLFMETSEEYYLLMQEHFILVVCSFLSVLERGKLLDSETLSLYFFRPLLSVLILTWLKTALSPRACKVPWLQDGRWMAIMLMLSPGVFKGAANVQDCCHFQDDIKKLMHTS